MIDPDIERRAGALGLTASDDDGFCTLRQAGRGIAARGDTWDEAFARYEAAEAQKPSALAAQSHASHEPLPPAEPGCLF